MSDETERREAAAAVQAVENLGVRVLPVEQLPYGVLFILSVVRDADGAHTFHAVKLVAVDT
jgi:hypothetical protein